MNDTQHYGRQASPWLARTWVFLMLCRCVLLGNHMPELPERSACRHRAQQDSGQAGVGHAQAEPADGGHVGLRARSHGWSAHPQAASAGRQVWRGDHGCSGHHQRGCACCLSTCPAAPSGCHVPMILQGCLQILWLFFLRIYFYI